VPCPRVPALTLPWLMRRRSLHASSTGAGSDLRLGFIVGLVVNARSCCRGAPIANPETEQRVPEKERRERAESDQQKTDDDQHE
jgi:hypothetical protein